MCKSLSKKRVLTQRDLALLKQRLGSKHGFIARVSALESLQSGEAAFIWESSFDASEEEMLDMARQAAADMAPEPGRVILSEIAYLIVSVEWCPHFMTVMQMFGLIHEGLNTGKYRHLILHHKRAGEKPHLILATAEGRAAESENAR